MSVTLDVAEQVNSGIDLTADFPSLSGDPGGTFTYTLTVANHTPDRADVHVRPDRAPGLDGDRLAVGQAKARPSRSTPAATAR